MGDRAAEKTADQRCCGGDGQQDSAYGVGPVAHNRTYDKTRQRQAILNDECWQNINSFNRRVNAERLPGQP